MEVASRDALYFTRDLFSQLQEIVVLKRTDFTKLPKFCLTTAKDSVLAGFISTEHKGVGSTEGHILDYHTVEEVFFHVIPEEEQFLSQIFSNS